MTIYQLTDFLKSQQLEFGSDQIDKLSEYLQLLKTWNKKMNLVSKGDQNHFVERHFLVSFYFVYILKPYISSESIVMDIGSGAGFPGIILSMAFPGVEIRLVDSSRKKALFLNKVIRELNLNAVTINKRIEQVASGESLKANIVTARALAAMSKLEEYGKSLIRGNGFLLTLKGRDYHKEFDGLSWNKTRLSEIEVEAPWKAKSDYLAEKIFIKCVF